MLRADATAATTVGGRHLSLRDAVVHELRERIVNQVFAQGQRLVERELSAELEVSRIPLREAILQLETEGLVRVVPRRGTFVATFSVRELEDFFDIREALEPLAARLAAQRATQADLTRLRAHLTIAEAAVLRTDDDVVARANADFHTEVVEIANNAFLSTLVRPLTTRLRWQFRMARELDLMAMCHEHEELFRAISAHDVEHAARFALQHASANRAASVAAFRDSEQFDANNASVS